MYWTEERLKPVRKVMEKATSYYEAGRILGENSSILENVCFKYKIPHPNIKRGGKRYTKGTQVGGIR